VQLITLASPAATYMEIRTDRPNQTPVKTMRPEAYEHKIDELTSRHPALTANFVSILMLAAALLALNSVL
jgi:hypothetical protein